MDKKEEIETENEAEFWERLRVLNVVRKRYYAMALQKNNEFKKVRKWLDNNDAIEVGTDSNKNIMLLNITRMDKCQNPDLFSRGH